MNIPKPVMRGLATFVILGSVAAVLPSMSDTANAANGCFAGNGPGRYAISPTAPATAPGSTNPATPDVQASYTLTTTSTAFKLYFSPDSTTAYAALGTAAGQNNTIQATSGALSVSGATVTAPASVTNTQASTSVKKVNSTTTGAGTFTSTYPSGGVTYTATVSLSAP